MYMESVWVNIANGEPQTVEEALKSPEKDKWK
jgi:hypothetical protein